MTTNTTAQSGLVKVLAELRAAIRGYLPSDEVRVRMRAWEWQAVIGALSASAQQPKINLDLTNDDLRLMAGEMTAQEIRTARAFLNWVKSQIGPAHIELDIDGRCVKCGDEMGPGEALEQTTTGSPDFAGGEVVTVSPGGPGKLVSCLKCSACGWSVTP